MSKPNRLRTRQPNMGGNLRRHYTSNELFATALHLQDAGDLAAAERCYRQLIAIKPLHADAHNNLGILLCSQNRPGDAITYFERAVTARPDYAEAHNNLANALHSVGRLEESHRHIRAALRLKPSYPEAHNNLGNLMCAQGSPADAITHFEQAIAARPDYVEAHNNLSNALHVVGRLEESHHHIRTALHLRPTYPEAHNNLGNLLLTLGRPQDACLCYKNALKVKPDYVEAHTNLAHALAELNLLGQANFHGGQAIMLRPGDPAAYNNFGNVLHKQGQFAQAEISLQKAIQLRPNYPEAHLNLANVLESQQQFKPALVFYEKALALRPGYALAHLNRSLLQLKMGNFASGWLGHEWRWRQTGIHAPRLSFAPPQWDGSPLNGARILLHAEQGLGDTIQFLRYVPMVRAAGGEITLELPPALQRLAEASLNTEIQDHTEQPIHLIVTGSPRPATDLHCPLMSLPLCFNTELHTIPDRVPYLSVPREANQKAVQLLGQKVSKMRVGLAWAGNPKHLRDRSRSIPLSVLATITQLEDISFVSLQIGPAAEELSQSEFPITDLCSAIDDMADTAALMQQLDLVITVDTSIAHLAGALGIPTWLLLSTDSDWRWLTDRDDSPWYPSIQIFRQSNPGDWNSMLERVQVLLLPISREKQEQVRNALK